MNITLWNAFHGNGVTVNLNGFEPSEGYEFFLRQLCSDFKEEFIDWQQGVESGIGHITFQSHQIVVFWTDFPFALSFDCFDQAQAEQLHIRLQKYLQDTGRGVIGEPR